MEKKIRTQMVEVSKEYFVAHDGTEFGTEEQCLAYERAHMAVENRSKRVQLLVKPSVNDALDRMVEEGKIKSKNDLVNFLLESYIAQLEG